jgi:ParB/RepB/Spo0J family partition protein
MKTHKTTRTYLDINIADIVSADENLRDAVPRLTQQGYGVFEGTEHQQDCLASLALSSDGMQQKKYVSLIETYEPQIKALAHNMATMGLLEPIRVRPAEVKGKYDLVYGCRRCLGWLYNYARAAGKIPARITAEVVDSDGEESLLVSLSENIRAEPSPIDEAKSYKKLHKSFGMKPSEIAKAMGKDDKVVRERLKLLQLPPEVQEKVHLGKMSQKHAIAMLDGKTKASAPQDPRRVPALKEIEKLYHAQKAELPDDYVPLITEDVRRVFAHWLKVNYAPQVAQQSMPQAEPVPEGDPA